MKNLDSGINEWGKETDSAKKEFKILHTNIAHHMNELGKIHKQKIRQKVVETRVGVITKKGCNSVVSIYGK
jgi:hypothetical protein